MLAVFDKTVAKCPQELRSPSPSASIAALKDGFISKEVESQNPNSITVNLSSLGFLSYSSRTTNPLLTRLFAVVDDIFCLFEGRLENITELKHQYGLSKGATEVIIVIEAYRTLRDRGPYPADQVVKGLNGKFAFILFDGSTKTAFLGVDADGCVPFFWGCDSETNLVVGNESEIVKKLCGKSFAPFPKGCFFTSSAGLQSFEYPLNQLKPVPRVDSSGDVCGASFQVDEQTKKETHSMPRVGSSYNWSSNY